MPAAMWMAGKRAGWAFFRSLYAHTLWKKALTEPKLQQRVLDVYFVCLPKQTLWRNILQGLYLEWSRVHWLDNNSKDIMYVVTENCIRACMGMKLVSLVKLPIPSEKYKPWTHNLTTATLLSQTWPDPNTKTVNKSSQCTIAWFPLPAGLTDKTHRNTSYMVPLLSGEKARESFPHEVHRHAFLINNPMKLLTSVAVQEWITLSS